MLPLDNIKVVDLSSRAPGPFCTMTLSDLGAEVLMVEAPPTVEIVNRPAGDVAGAREAALDPLRRNKRTIVLNLKHPDALDLFHRLAKDADVVVEGFRPGVAQRLRVDYETLKALNPRLVYCAISGYGQDGPYRLLPGHDVNYISFAGVLSLIGPRDGPPSIPFNLLGDYAAGGLLSAVAILTALWARERTGRGQYIDMSMTDGSLYLIAPVLGAYFARGKVPVAGMDRLNGATPDYQVFRCRDGRYLSVGCLESKFWANLCAAVGRPELVPAQHDASRHQAAIGELQAIFATRSRDEWFDLLAAREVAVGKVYTVDEVPADPQMRARGAFVTVQAEDGLPAMQVGVAPRLSGTPGRVRFPGSLPGAHTREVLAELGYDSAGIETLHRDGAVQ